MQLLPDDAERDFYGYGATPPDPRWPGGARVAININLNYEAGGEHCLLEGDSASEGMLNDIGFPAYEGVRSPIVESAFEYGSRCGVWRLLRVFARFGVPVSILAVVRALERNPEVARAMIAAGHEIASHGYRWIDYQFVPEEIEHRHLGHAIDRHKRVTGARPLGWYLGRCSPNTQRLVAEEGGFLYDSTAMPTNSPIGSKSPGGPISSFPIPSTPMTWALPPDQGFNAGDQFFTYLKDSFDLLYAEGETSPRMMSVGLHCRLVGRPGRAAALARFLDYVRGHDRVWVGRRIDIARHWRQHFPPRRAQPASKLAQILLLVACSATHCTK